MWLHRRRFRPRLDQVVEGERAVWRQSGRSGGQHSPCLVEGAHLPRSDALTPTYDDRSHYRPASVSFDFSVEISARRRCRERWSQPDVDDKYAWEALSIVL